jgi:repressor LexA
MQTRTRRQREVLDFITRFIERNGHAPSYQTVARHLGVASKTAIGKHIRALEDQGLLHRQRAGKSFRLMLGRPKNATSAENAIEWILPQTNGNNNGNTETSAFALPDFLLGERDPAEMLAFRMPDDGMSDKNICEGDIVLVEKRSYGRDGDCLAITVNGSETTLRKFYRAGADIELRSSSDDFPSLRLSADEIEIHGVYRGLLRPAG